MFGTSLLVVVSNPQLDTGARAIESGHSHCSFYRARSPPGMRVQGGTLAQNVKVLGW